MQWPYLEDDYMEIGKTGWIPISNGGYKNINNGHTIDKDGLEYDANGNLIKEKQ